MKTIIRLCTTTAAVALAITLFSCGGESKTDRLQAQLDSLTRLDSINQQDIASMVGFVNIMSEGLDSITTEEGVLREMSTGENRVNDKQRLRQQLTGLGQLISRQRDRINELEAQLKDNGTNYTAKIKKLIANYKQQLDEKDHTIAQLQAELNNKNADIKSLNESVQKLTTSNSDMTRTIEDQKSVMAQQDETLHEGYVTIGTSKELKAKGIIKGGFLAKKKVVTSNLTAQGFTKIDIRNYNNILLQSKNPKVMTQMPASSYDIQQNADGTSTLHITNYQAFWSVSKYLVIRL